ncbi:hypothetical protein T492DRAFT_310621 [Pavlovales sp. CCMP2436]|nr:hypothetical protein T492DRAFT_310621 [Pavlovales sp. CCMP2436]
MNTTEVYFQKKKLQKNSSNIFLLLEAVVLYVTFPSALSPHSIIIATEVLLETFQKLLNCILILNYTYNGCTSRNCCPLLYVLYVTFPSAPPPIVLWARRRYFQKAFRSCSLE